MNEAIDSIFIPRAGTPEEREKVIEVIKERQEIIETTGKFTQLLIFPEGTTTNGSSVVKFKKGALISERTL